MYKLKNPQRPPVLEEQEQKKSLKIEDKVQKQSQQNQQIEQQKDQKTVDKCDKKQYQKSEQVEDKYLEEQDQSKQNDTSGELLYEEKVQHKSTSYLYLRCQNAAWGACVAGYTVSELGLSFDHLAVRYNLDHTEKRNIVAFGVMILSIGAMISAFVSHFVMNKIKRCNYMIIADLICILGTCLFQITHWSALILARFIMGLGIGMNACVIPLYIREVSPDNMAGKTGALFQANINLGIVFGFILNLPLESVDNNTTYVGNIWRLVFLFPIIFSLIRIATMLFAYQIDTPYFYYLKRRNKEGRIAIQQIYKDEYVMTMEKSLLIPDGGMTDLSVRNQSALSPEDSKKSYMKRLAVGVGVNFFQQMTGNTYLGVYSVAILSVFETDYPSLLTLVLGTYIFLFFISIIGISFNTKLIRKKYLMMGLIFSSAFQFTQAGLISHEEFSKDNPTMKFLFILFLLLFYASFHLSIGPVTSIFTADILKDDGLSYSFTANWLASAFSLVLFFNDIYYINHIIFGGFSLLGFFFSYKYIIETNEMTFKQIERKYLVK